MGVAGRKIMRPTKSNKSCLPVAPTWRMWDSRKHCKKKQYLLPRNELIQSPWESRKKSWHYNHDKVFWIRDPVKVKTQAVSSPSGTWVTRHTTNNWQSFSRIAAETNWSCNYEMPGCHFIVFDSQNYGGGFSFPFCALRVLAAHFWLRCHQRASDLQRDTISAFVSHFQLPLSTFPAVVALNKQELSVVWFIFSQRGRKKTASAFWSRSTEIQIPAAASSSGLSFRSARDSTRYMSGLLLFPHALTVRLISAQNLPQGDYECVVIGQHENAH